jgi:hypothetical protein
MPLMMVLTTTGVLMLDRGEEEVVAWNVWCVGHVPMGGPEGE